MFIFYDFFLASERENIIDIFLIETFAMRQHCCLKVCNGFLLFHLKVSVHNKLYDDGSKQRYAGGGLAGL